MKKDEQFIEKMKERLLAEKSKLESELSGVGVQNPKNSIDWEGKADDMDIDRADEDEVAQKTEELEVNSALTGGLETRLNEINATLEKISVGSYGICSVCGEEISDERLEANPAAQTCIKHM